MYICICIYIYTCIHVATTLHNNTSCSVCMHARMYVYMYVCRIPRRIIQHHVSDYHTMYMLAHIKIYTTSAYITVSRTCLDVTNAFICMYVSHNVLLLYSTRSFHINTYIHTYIHTCMHETCNCAIRTCAVSLCIKHTCVVTACYANMYACVNFMYVQQYMSMRLSVCKYVK